MGKPLVTVEEKKTNSRAKVEDGGHLLWWKKKGGQKYNKQDETQGDSICARL